MKKKRKMKEKQPQECYIDLTKPKIPVFTLAVNDPESLEQDEDGKTRVHYDTMKTMNELFSAGIVVYAKNKDGSWKFDKKGQRDIAWIGQNEKGDMELDQEAEINKKVYDACYDIFELDRSTITADNALYILKGFMAHVQLNGEGIKSALSEKQREAKVKKKTCLGS
jgi:hypothetical protein